ncbi:CHAT domain-containing protein [Mycena leptocephala]|nr:CHAT domain-containing protein [Mycena leptocephala]
MKDLVAIHIHYNKSFKLSTSSPEKSWQEALAWAYFSQEFQPSYCVPAFRAAFDLLPQILWMGHSIPLRHDAIQRLNLSGATSTAVRTCIGLSHFREALELLEQGIATIFQQMLQLKTDVDVLPPDQAKELLQLSSQLYGGTFTNPITITEDRNKLLKEIRKEPRFQYFLLPKPYNDLCHAAQGGPVIILTSHKDHCDALILPNPTSDPVTVPLPTATLELLNKQRDTLKDLLRYCPVRNRGESSSSRLFAWREQFTHQPTKEYFEDMLNWLWMNVVDPVYQVLKSHGILNGRLWWLPTGAFTGLPLHASASTDEFIHSYTATLGSLLDAYAKKSSITAPKLAVVGVTYTNFNKSRFLKGVEPEVKKIISIAKDCYVQCLLGEQATVDAVKLQLQECSWVHLACHGYQNLENPTQSHLQLYGGNLDLDTILRMPLPNAQFVFLAACQTAMGDANLANESFHLGGGFITAGFQSVIGTMWSMNDNDGPTVAESVYSHLFRKGQQPKHTDAAEALQLAVKELKCREVPHERWIPFIHIGV